MRETDGIEVSPDLVGAVVGAVLNEVIEWQKRSLKPLYLLICLEPLRVKTRDEGTVRDKAVYILLGVLDILIAVGSGLNKLRRAIATAVPKIQIQACAVHLV